MLEPDIPAKDCDDRDNVERELQELGWQPVLMRDQGTGLPFTRWFPPARTLDDLDQSPFGQEEI